jgi:dipeptidyl aminopeptidase/acylaminoacyl peptidase
VEDEREELVALCPVRNVGKDFPPTLFLHGTNDQDVPYAQSVEMVAALEEAGVDCELIIVEGGGHGLWGGDKEKVVGAFEASIEYMRESFKME